MKLNAKLDRLGTETAFAVSAQAKAWADKGNKVYPFHLGDINLQTPSNIREATNRYMNDAKNGYCAPEGIPELRLALAHDVCRAVPGDDLLKMSADLGVTVTDVDRDFPLLLHGPVGAELLRQEEDLNDLGLYEAVRWHSTAHASLDDLGKLVFLADKLDPQKSAVYSYQARLHEMAQESLDLALLEFLSREMAARLEKGETVHPASVDARNSLVLRLKS